MLLALPIFNGIEPAIVNRVLNFVKYRDFTAGEYIIKEGQAGNEFFVLVSGGAAVMQEGKVIATLKPGAAFGEIALIQRVKRTASVRAENTSHVAVFEKRFFDLLFLAESSARKQLTENIRSLNSSQDLKSAA